MSNANFTSVLPTPAERTREAAMVTVKKIPGRGGDFGVVALENIPAHKRIMVYPGKIIGTGNSNDGRYTWSFFRVDPKKGTMTANAVNISAGNTVYRFNANGRPKFAAPFVNEPPRGARGNIQVVWNLIRKPVPAIEYWSSRAIRRGDELFVCYGRDYNRNDYAVGSTCHAGLGVRYIYDATEPWPKSKPNPNQLRRALLEKAAAGTRLQQVVNASRPAPNARKRVATPSSSSSSGSPKRRRLAPSLSTLTGARSAADAMMYLRRSVAPANRAVNRAAPADRAAPATRTTNRAAPANRAANRAAPATRAAPANRTANRAAQITYPEKGVQILNDVFKSNSSIRTLGAETLVEYGKMVRAILRERLKNRDTNLNSVAIDQEHNEYFHPEYMAWITTSHSLFNSKDIAMTFGPLMTFDVSVSSIPRSRGWSNARGTPIPNHEVSVEVKIDTARGTHFGQLNYLRVAYIGFSITFDLDEYGIGPSPLHIQFEDDMRNVAWNYRATHSQVATRTLSTFISRVLPGQLQSVTHGPLLDGLKTPDKWVRVFKTGKLSLAV